MVVERQAVHAGRCPTLQSSRPRARIRSLAAAHRDVRQSMEETKLDQETISRVACDAAVLLTEAIRELTIPQHLVPSAWRRLSRPRRPTQLPCDGSPWLRRSSV